MDMDFLLLRFFFFFRIESSLFLLECFAVSDFLFCLRTSSLFLVN